MRDSEARMEKRVGDVAVHARLCGASLVAASSGLPPSPRGGRRGGAPALRRVRRRRAQLVRRKLHEPELWFVRVQSVRGKDETCPVSTGEGTKRVQSVREEGEGGGR
jgi:hypothetical protein